MWTNQGRSQPATSQLSTGHVSLCESCLQGVQAFRDRGIPVSYPDHPEMLEQRPVQEGKETWYRQPRVTLAIWTCGFHTCWTLQVVLK